MNLREQLDWEDGLAVGDTVLARWTNSYNYYEARATVRKLNRKSLRVILEEPTGGYPEGWEILLPRQSDIFGAARWSVNNGAFPYPGVAT